MNPLILLGAIPSALAVGGLAWLLHSVDVSRIEAKQAKALTEQAETLNKQCTDKIAATEANNENWVKSTNALSSQYDAVMHSLSVCKRDTIRLRSAAATSSVSTAYTAGKPVHKDAVDIGDFVTYGRDTENLRQSLISCKQDSDAIRALNRKTP